ncbi:hypothetical protein BDR07DRAFT_1486744 [Suillus spraguei]|nr:hypothetical protein BDR07DRAFT_1486744 [Suillus spraguei]
MDFRWTKSPSGQYVDGHEWEDVVTYRQTKFLLMVAKLSMHMCTWKDGLEEASDEPRPHTQRVVMWYHDESTFYANDHRKVYWIMGGCTRVLVKNWRKFFSGQGRPVMIFTNDAILCHADLVMGILDRHFLIFDNATTHLKQADNALSARHMPKFLMKAGGIPFGVSRIKTGSDGKPIYSADGRVLTEKIRMADGQLTDGTTQCFYFPECHEHAGAVKTILKVREIRRALASVHALCPFLE